MIAISLVMCFTFVSCGSSDDSKEGTDDNLKAILLDNKWIMRDYSYGEGNDDHVWVDEESTTLYFNTESSGFEYWLQKDYDSDLGNSINKSYVLFDYEVSGNRVQITNEKGYNSTLYYREGLLTNENGDLFYMPSPLNSDDREFMAGIGPKEGKCGDNLYYEYNGRNRLTIKGSGRVYDYTEGKQPWADDVIETLTIEDGCTYIGKHAFNCTKIEGEVSFPSTLEEIGEYAFYSANIVSLNISNCDRLEYIGSNAFACCPIYEYNFVLPKNLKEIGMSAFVWAYFDQVTLNEGLETIGEYAFGNLGSSPIEIPNSVKKIGYGAFAGYFSEIRLGTGIQEISSYAFHTKSRSGKIYVNQSTPVSTNGASVVLYYNEMQDAAPYWTLYVPKGSKSAYQYHQSWRIFKYIYEDTSLDGDGDSQPDDSGQETRTFTVRGVTCNMKLVEAGTFQMGSTTGLSDEAPVHSVTITKDYYMGETEVTQALWKAVTGYSPTIDGYSWSSIYGLGDNYPAYYISYEDVQKFITKLNNMTGENFRMPTEAEWEFAARGGNKSIGYNYSGSNTIDDVAWYYENSSNTTHTVKTKAANELGIYDMSGNVWEWCSDWYDTYSSNSQTDPTGPTTGSIRVIRGGGRYGNATSCRCTDRDNGTPSSRYNGLGFRLAL